MNEKMLQVDAMMGDRLDGRVPRIRTAHLNFACVGESLDIQRPDLVTLYTLQSTLISHISPYWFLHSYIALSRSVLMRDARPPYPPRTYLYTFAQRTSIG